MSELPQGRRRGLAISQSLLGTVMLLLALGHWGRGRTIDNVIAFGAVAVALGSYSLAGYWLVRLRQQSRRPKP